MKVKDRKPPFVLPYAYECRQAGGSSGRFHLFPEGAAKCLCGRHARNTTWKMLEWPRVAQIAIGCANRAGRLQATLKTFCASCGRREVLEDQCLRCGAKAADYIWLDHFYTLPLPNLTLLCPAYRLNEAAPNGIEICQGDLGPFPVSAFRPVLDEDWAGNEVRDRPDLSGRCNRCGSYILAEQLLGDNRNRNILAQYTYNWAAHRHGELVDKKFLAGLTNEEAEELERINGLLDAMEAPYYEPIIKRLKFVKEQLERDRANHPTT